MYDESDTKCGYSWDTSTSRMHQRVDELTSASPDFYTPTVKLAKYCAKDLGIWFQVAGRSLSTIYHRKISMTGYGTLWQILGWEAHNILCWFWRFLLRHCLAIILKGKEAICGCGTSILSVITFILFIPSLKLQEIIYSINMIYVGCSVRQQQPTARQEITSAIVFVRWRRVSYLFWPCITAASDMKKKVMLDVKVLFCNNQPTIITAAADISIWAEIMKSRQPFTIITKKSITF